MDTPKFTALRFDVQDGIALMTIDVPGRPMNVLTPDLQAEIAGESLCAWDCFTAQNPLPHKSRSAMLAKG